MLSVEGLAERLKQLEERISSSEEKLKEVNGQLHEVLLSGSGGTNDILSQTPLAECMEQLATMSWSSSGKCQVEPVAVQAMMKNLLKIVQAAEEDGDTLRDVLWDLLALRDIDGVRLPPPLAVHDNSLTSPSGLSGGPMTVSSASLNSFTDTDEEHIRKAWQQVCSILDGYLQKCWEGIVNAPFPYQHTLLGVWLSQVCLVCTPSMAWHRCCQLRRKQMTISIDINGQSLQERACSIVQMLPADLAVAIHLRLQPPVEALQEIHLTTLVEDTAKMVFGLLGVTRDEEHPEAVRPSERQSMFLAATDRNTDVESDLTQLALIFKQFGEITSTVQRLLLEHGRHSSIGTSVGQGEGQKPPSPRPNLQRTMQHTLSSPRRLIGSMGVIKEDDNEGYPSQAAAGELGQGALLPGVTMSRHAQEKWRWADTMEGCAAKLGDELGKLLKEKCTSWLSVESEQLSKFARNAENVAEMFSVHYGSQCMSEACTIFINTVDKLFPLCAVPEQAGGGTWPTRKTFVEQLEEGVSTLLDLIEEACIKVPSKSVVVCLFYALSCLSFLRMKLSDYQEQLANRPRHAFVSCLRELSSLHERLLKKLKLVQFTFTDNILQDAASQDWSDQKAFFQMEFCSYPVQAWHYHLTGLWHDLQACGELFKQSHAVLFMAEVLQYGLDTLCSRYIALEPTCKRTPLFRADITAILFVATHYIWCLTPSVTLLLSPNSLKGNGDALYECISAMLQSCRLLVVAMTLVGAPLATLHQHFVNMPADRWTSDGTAEGNSRLSSSPQSSCGSRQEWLKCLYPESLGAFGSGEGEHKAILCHVVALAARPWNGKGAESKLLLQSLMQEDSPLAKTLVIAASRSDDKAIAFDRLVWPLYHIAITCGEWPSVAGHIVCALFEQEQSHSQDFLAQPITMAKHTEKIPLWFRCLYGTLRSVVERVLAPHIIQLGPLCFEHSGAPRQFIKQLPCGCSRSSALLKDQGLSISEVTIEFLNELSREVASLPSGLLFSCEQLSGAFKEASIPCVHPLLAVLAQSVSLLLFELQQDSSLVKFLPSASLANQFVSSVWSGFGCSIGKMTVSSLTRAWAPAQSAYVKQLQESFAKIALSSLNCSAPDDDSTSKENQLVVCARRLSCDEECTAALKKVHTIIHRNACYLLNGVSAGGIGAPSEGQAANSPVEFDMSHDDAPNDSVCFTPLRAFRYLGDKQFNSNLVSSISWPWTDILTSMHPLPANRVRTLLSHRYEFREPQHLRGDEPKLVADIRQTLLMT